MKPRDRVKEIVDCMRDACNEDKRERMYAYLDAARAAVEQLESDRQYHMGHVNRLEKALGMEAATTEAVIDRAIQRITPPLR